MYDNHIFKLSEIRLAMFADDTAVYAVDRSAEMMAVMWLQEQIDVEWVSINLAKITTVFFSRCRKLDST